jgi:hypothetical protein
VKKEVIHDLNKRYKKHVASDEIGQWMDKGVKMAYLKNLLSIGQTAFNWQSIEDKINAYPHLLRR